MQVYKHVVVLLINERRWQCFLSLKKQTVIANCKTLSPIIRELGRHELSACRPPKGLISTVF